MADLKKKYTVNSPERVEEIIMHVADLLDDNDFHEEDIAVITVGLEEMIFNGLEHGNKNNESKKVYVNLTINEEKAEIKIKDEGEGFDYQETPDPTDINRLMRLIEDENVGAFTHGRGIWMTREYMDEFYYNKKGNEVTLVKLRGKENENASKTQEETDYPGLIKWNSSITQEDLLKIKENVIDIDFADMPIISSSELSKILYLMKNINKGDKKIRLYAKNKKLKASFENLRLDNFDFVEIIS